MRLALTICFLSVALKAPLSQGAEPTPQQALRTQAESILVRRCLECHGEDGRGGLNLQTQVSALKGGDSGAVIVPGKPEESLLFDHVETGHMPPRQPLAAEEVAVLRRWIADGAAYPDGPLDLYAFGTEHRAGYDWWSLKPVRKPAVPQVADESMAGRVRTPVDAFVAAKLVDHKLTFSPAADRATYIRRVTVDLHGLPPTFEEVQEFLADTRPDAYEQLVDRLLASPRYGERWGRHWLDVVRFAESNGFERDRLRPHFWRYRDYVISAFNRDLPYNDFVREQLAGDALRPHDPQALIATGFLVGGPKNDVGTISELERLTTRQDELDEYVVATTTTFLGLTVGCARCHDHKFDPIPARDYYALTAVFSGLDRGDRVTATPTEHEQYAAAVRPLQEQIDRTKSEIEALLRPVRERLTTEAQTATKPAAGIDLPVLAVDHNLDTFPTVSAKFVRFTILATNGGTQPCLDELQIFSPDVEGNVALAATGAKASASSLLPGYPIHQIAHLNDGKFGNEQSWISNEAGTGWVQIELPRVINVHRVGWGRDRNRKYSDRLPIDYRIEVSTDRTQWITVSSAARRPKTTPARTEPQVPLADVLAALQPAARSRHQELAADLARCEADLKNIPPLPLSYAAIDGALREAFVLKRGNVRERAEPVQPTALTAVHPLDPNLKSETGDSGPERRRRLAEWIVDPRNPLTARVIVNRVWHYHFGQGLVDTPSDFGFNGDRPSHPELLDWLASDFMEHQWQFKRLHRLLVLSEIYRQSSQLRPEAAAVDGNNRLLWRMNPRRLESEAVRDAILQTSGKLDLRVGGPSFRLFQYRDGNVPDYLLLEAPGPETWRRSVYMFNIRTFQEPLMSVFDCPDPSVQTPRRERSTTALQALSLMNNPFVFEQSQYFAARILDQPGTGNDVPEQVNAAYRLACARLPTAAEQERAVAFVRANDLFSLCRVLLNSNEFLYLK